MIVVIINIIIFVIIFFHHHLCNYDHYQYYRLLKVLSSPLLWLHYHCFHHYQYEYWHLNYHHIIVTMTYFFKNHDTIIIIPFLECRLKVTNGRDSLPWRRQNGLNLTWPWRGSWHTKPSWYIMAQREPVWMLPWRVITFHYSYDRNAWREKIRIKATCWQYK